MDCWTHNTILFFVQGPGEPHCANEKGKEALTKSSSYEHTHKSNPSRNNENTCSRSRSICRTEPKRKLMHEAFYSTNYQRILVTKEKKNKGK